MSYAELLDEWRGLLDRRPTFRNPLAPYGRLLEAWAAGRAPRLTPLAWARDDCTERWQQGIPLLAEAPLTIPPEGMEDLLAIALEVLATSDEQAGLRRFAEAWDRAEITPADLFPRQGRWGSPSVQQSIGLSHDALGMLAVGSLRPILEPYLVTCREHLAAGTWDLGICPLCGAPPGFGDLLDDGRRRLACHLCGAGWSFSRLRCPYCGSDSAQDFVRLLAEEKEEGYAIWACKACNGYLKELDRRLRWNVGSALVEDWGSPHLDLIAMRAGYWRGVPTLIRMEASR